METRRYSFIALACAAALTFGLSGCAPEPGDVAGSTEKDVQTINPESESSEREVSSYETNTTIPETFPSDEFRYPENAQLTDVGERGAEQWFIVFQADDAALAAETWQSIIDLNQFGVIDESETVEGGVVATLVGSSLSAQALTIPQADGSVQLSYDLSR